MIVEGPWEGDDPTYSARRAITPKFYAACSARRPTAEGPAIADRAPSIESLMFE